MSSSSSSSSNSNQKLKVVVIGGGISGIATGIRLSEALGDRLDLTIIEKKGSPGGVWRDSKWPGAGVDVPIHLYSLYSDLNPEWDTVFASQPEVLAYWEKLVDKHELRDTFLFNNEFTASTWDETSQTHTVTVKSTITGSTLDLTANILVSAAGPLVMPVIPNIPGVEQFAGDYFHNLHWDTGVQLAGKRVAVVGNGSSGVQLIPGVAELPGVTLTHYIRSGGYFIPKPQRNYSDWEKFAFRYIPGWIQLHRYLLLLQHDREWSLRTVGRDAGREAAEAELLQYLKDKAPKEYLDALTPHYPLGTKRPALNLGWLESLHRPNVSLVNTRITRVHPTGIETADGTLREHDVIIFATGSDVPHEGVGVNRNVFGEGGKELRTYWDEVGGPKAYKGLAVPHFPNYFIVIGPNGTAGSWGWTLGQQSRAIANIAKSLVTLGLSSMQPKEAPFTAHNSAIQAVLQRSAAASKDTNNWWRTESGLVVVTNPQTGQELRATVNKGVVWDDWEAKAVGADGKVKSVDVGAVVRRRRLRAIALSGVLAGVIAWYVPHEVWRGLAGEVVSINKQAMVAVMKW